MAATVGGREAGRAGHRLKVADRPEGDRGVELDHYGRDPGSQTTSTWIHGARRRPLAVLAALALLASLITVLSPPAWGSDNPIVECASPDPEWIDDLGQVTLCLTDDDDDDEDEDDDEDDEDEDEDEDDDEDDEDDDDEDDSEGPTTTTTTAPGSTTTTAPGSTTTTAPGSTTTTSGGPPTATSPASSSSPPPGESTATPASVATTTNTAVGSTDVGESASNASQTDESDEAADGSGTNGSENEGPVVSPPEGDRDTTRAVLVAGGSGEALGQGSNAAPDAIPNSGQWPTRVDLAILGALIAAIAVLVARRRLDFRRLIGK